MYGKDTTKTTFFQLLKPAFQGRLLQLLKEKDVDKYVKKLTSIKLFRLLVYAQLEQLAGLRDISNSLHNEAHNQNIGLDSISFSQISRRLRAMPTSVVQVLLQELINQCGAKPGLQKIRNNLGRIYLIDASVISLCLSRFQWAKFRSTKGGIKLHLRLRLFEKGVFPDHAEITPAKLHDNTQMDNLIVHEKGAINVFDRGYIDYTKFDSYCDNGILFVSRLKKNAVADVQVELPVDPQSAVKRDYIATLGTANKKMQHPLRLIETTDTEGNLIIIVTNAFHLSTDELSELYRYRWQIEIFFKWLKQNLHVKHMYGMSQQAVENQIYIALATYCLLLILQLDTGFKGSLLTIKRLLRACLYDPFEVLIKKLISKGKRKTKGRRRLDHELVFRETLHQFMVGDTEHLNDLTYDPVIL